MKNQKVYTLKEETFNNEHNLYLTLTHTKDRALELMEDKVLGNIKKGYSIYGGGEIGDEQLYLENEEEFRIVYTIEEHVIVD